MARPVPVRGDDALLQECSDVAAAWQAVAAYLWELLENRKDLRPDRRVDARPVAGRGMKQLELVDAPPRLTDRQTFALAAIAAAGYDGLTSDELGAVVHSFALNHSAGERCGWCQTAGLEVGKALRKKAAAQQRRRRLPDGSLKVLWTFAGTLERPDPSGMSDRIPF